MNEDVLIVSYDKGYDGEIPILLVGRKTDKGMEIIKAFDRDKADKMYEMLTKRHRTKVSSCYVIGNIKYWKYVINDN